ncbi:hypothetical protein Tco_1290056 [Tanacetum coccineum]
MVRCKINISRKPRKQNYRVHFANVSNFKVKSEKNEKKRITTCDLSLPFHTNDHHLHREPPAPKPPWAPPPSKTSPSLQPLNATNNRQIIDINYRRPPLFALTNSPSLMIPEILTAGHPLSSSPGQETGCFMAPVAYVDCDTDGLGCTVAIAIMDAKCLTKEGYAGNHPAGRIGGWTGVYGKEVDITLSNYSYPLMYGADGWENVEASVRATEMLQMDGK